MATKAESFRYIEERSHPKKAPVQRTRLEKPADAGMARNWMKHPRGAEYVLEPTHGGRPSRKSTRHSATGVKPGQQARMAKRGAVRRDSLKARARYAR